MILHVDADAFFASCEQALHPELRHKPVVVGGDRGIVTAASYEAKALGVKRGMPTFKLRQQFPNVIVVNSNYADYEDFSDRIFQILIQTSPCVEAYSIDESFADMTGLDKMYKKTWEQIATDLQTIIWDQLHVGVSIGIAPNKVLAKIASGWHKPKGITVIRNSDQISSFLQQVPISDVWGIGWRTQPKLLIQGVATAHDFANKSFAWVKQNFPKPFQRIHLELNGQKILSVDSQLKDTYASISKTRTFYPTTRDQELLFAYLMRNLDRALAKSRLYGLSPRRIGIFLKTHGKNGKFKYFHQDQTLTRPTNMIAELSPVIKQLFNQIYNPEFEYRATGIFLNELKSASSTQLFLGENPKHLRRIAALTRVVDQIRAKHGFQVISPASSLNAMRKIKPESERVGLKVKVSF